MMTLRNFLEIIELRQYPERIRTAYDTPFGFKRAYFPCLSIGEVGIINAQVMPHPDYVVWPVAFFHERPWKNLDDAAKIVCQLPGSFHPMTEYGVFCPGNSLALLLAKSKITPEEAFYNSGQQFEEFFFFKGKAKALLGRSPMRRAIYKPQLIYGYQRPLSDEPQWIPAPIRIKPR